MKPAQESLEKLHELYASSTESVRGRGYTEDLAARQYSKYIEFVKQTSDQNIGKLLDLGCGNGWSSYFLADAGFDVTGLDLNPEFFEPPPRPNVRFTQGSMLALPVEDGSFDLVASYQALEHVPDPEQALREMLRAVRPGGTITIVSPNMLSILSPLAGMTRYAWRNRPLMSILIRTPDMPRHPPGNTLPENVASLFGNSLSVLKKLLSRDAQFTMREPDLRPPFHADNDACYVCNPFDLLKFFRAQGCQVLRCGFPGRPPLSWLVTTGTFITVRKNG
jgi:SAM-dependent methyltransferase